NRDRRRGGRRRAPSTGGGGGRRSALLAVPHALHHARDLHLHGVVPRLAPSVARTSGAGRARGRPARGRARQTRRGRGAAPARRLVVVEWGGPPCFSAPTVVRRVQRKPPPPSAMSRSLFPARPDCAKIGARPPNPSSAGASAHGRPCD